MYATNNSSFLKLYDNSLLLVTTAVYVRHLLNFFPPSLKQEVERLLKLEVKKHSCRETGQSSHLTLVQPNNPKTKLSTNYVPNGFKSSTPSLKQKQVQPLTKAGNKI